jgi:CDP-glucose 4,6-dehydratase
MSRVLITGASGFLGSQLARNLSFEGHTVIALERDLNKKACDPFADFVVRGDVTDANLIRRVVADYEVESVYHLAAQSIVRICAADPVSAYQANVMGTVNLLEAIRTSGMNHIKSVVISTSDKAYGHAPVPYTEDTPLMPKFTYECTKACQDIVGQNFFHNYGVPVKIARCSNIYGPGDPNWSRLIPNSIRRALQGQKPQLYSDVADYVREFVYIDDTIDAFKLIDKAGVPGDAYCIGGTTSCKIKDLISMILELCEVDPAIEIINKPATFKEIEQQFIDGTKIKALGWNPQFSLQKGLTETIEYYKDLLNVQNQ